MFQLSSEGEAFGFAGIFRTGSRQREQQVQRPRLGPWRTAGVRAAVYWRNKQGKAWSLGPHQPPGST